MYKSGAKLTMVSVLVILLAILLAALLAYLTPASVDTGADADWAPVVEEGRLPGYEDSPVNNDGRYFYYQLCKEVTFNKPTAPGNVLIENTTGNTCDMQVEYQLADDGTVIYTSPMLKPGQHLLEDKLSAELEEGSYDVVAKIYVYDQETGDIKDDFSENITVVVKNKLF